MKFQPNTFYHVLNQGNNRELIFTKDYHYFLFIKLFKEKVSPFCDVAAYCLMPNHFHFLLQPNEYGASIIKIGNVETTQLSNGIRLLLSSYATIFNRDQFRSGSLFRQKTKSKCCNSINKDYAANLFQFIHQIPVENGLVELPEDWQFSSLRDYLFDQKNFILNKALITQLIDNKDNDFIQSSHRNEDAA